jgi:hypothetical protein
MLVWQRKEWMEQGHNLSSQAGFIHAESADPVLLLMLIWPHQVTWRVDSAIKMGSALTIIFLKYGSQDGQTRNDSLQKYTKGNKPPTKTTKKKTPKPQPRMSRLASDNAEQPREKELPCLSFFQCENSNNYGASQFCNLSNIPFRSEINVDLEPFFFKMPGCIPRKLRIWKIGFNGCILTRSK